jgi:hypothetical protein
VSRNCHLGGKRVSDDDEFETELRKFKKATMLWVSTHWEGDGKSLRVLMLMEDMSINKCSFHVRISHGLHFISTCDLFTDDSPLYFEIVSV